MLALGALAQDGLVSVPTSSIATITGTLTATLDAAALTSASTVALKASLSSTLDNVSLSATGTLAIKANASISLDAATVNSAATLAIKASAAITLDNATLSAAGAVPSVTASLNVTLDDISFYITSHFEAPGSGKRKNFPSYIPQPAYEAKKRPPFQPIWDRNRQVEQRRRELDREAAARLPPPMPPAGIFAMPQSISYPQPTQFAPHQVVRIAQQSRDAQDIADIQDVANMQSQDISDIQDVSDIMTLIEGIE